MNSKHDAPDRSWRCMNSGGQPYWLMPIPGWMFACTKVAAADIGTLFCICCCSRQNWTTHAWKWADTCRLACTRIRRRRYIVLGWVDVGQLRSSSVVSWWFRRTLGSFEPNLRCQWIVVARNLQPPPASQGSSSVSPGSPLSSGGSTCPGWFGTGPASPPGPCLVRQWIWTVVEVPAGAGPCPSQESRARRGPEIRSPCPPTPDGTPASWVRACRWCPGKSESSRRPSRAAALSAYAPPSAQPRQGWAHTAMG